jgi:hypothetical protein
MAVKNVRHMVMNVDGGVMPVFMTMPFGAGIPFRMLVLVMLVGMPVHVVVYHGLVPVRMNVRFVE